MSRAYSIMDGLSTADIREVLNEIGVVPCENRGDMLRQLLGILFQGMPPAMPKAAPSQEIDGFEPNQVTALDFHALGVAAYRAASDAFAEDMPPYQVGYNFLLCNPECFAASEQPWPDGMPTEPPAAFIAGWKSERSPRNLKEPVLRPGGK